ncbi:MAG: IPT/TIG domain-containing protein [bacterium]
MKKSLKKIIIFAGVVAILIGATQLCFAQTTAPDLGIQQVGNSIGLPSTDIRLIIARIIRVALSLLGIVAVSIMVYGGFIWMTSAGSEEKISTAKKILINGAIGLAIILSSYAIVSFVISKLVEATTGVPSHCSNQIFDAGVEEQMDCGIECPPCQSPPNPYFYGNSFRVVNLPPGGSTCIRNVKLAVTFNFDVDITTLNNNVVVNNKNTNVQMVGDWSWQSGDNKNAAVFTPQGACGPPDNGNDCLEAKTDYILNFKNPASVKTLENLNDKSLKCVGNECADVNFTTGEGIDRTAPSITAIIPTAPLLTESTIPIQINYSDDNGVQKIDLKADNNFVNSASPSQNCAKTGNVTINWPTSQLASGDHLLQAIALDWAALSGSATKTVKLLPPHCVNNIRDIDEDDVDCGGVDCYSCDIMRITFFDPQFGSPGTYVTISGYKFGTTTGEVFMQDRADKTKWVKAELADCGFSTWSNNQIIIKVPSTAATSTQIKVITATTTDKGGLPIRYSDTTKTPPDPELNDFTINTTTSPGLCYITPISGPHDAIVTAIGNNFGQNMGSMRFGISQASMLDWTSGKPYNIAKAMVPRNLNPGVVSVKVVNNAGILSNGVRFAVTGAQIADGPLISSISPSSGAKGQYITITGKNFGSSNGTVNFKSKNQFDKFGYNTSAVRGDFEFPKGCVTVWSDKQIVVKFPTDSRATALGGASGIANESYYIEVNNIETNKSSQLPGPDSSVFGLISGSAGPGICAIKPVSSPVPLPAQVKMELIGEYFGSLNPNVFFWGPASVANTFSSRLRAPSSSVALSSSGIGQKVTLNLIPTTTISGPVLIERQNDSALSNEVDFSVFDCTSNIVAGQPTCTMPNTRCCVSGNEAGICKPIGELCDGETKSTGYVWKLSTRALPEIPRVVEQCYDSALPTGEFPLPSPTPDTKWGPDHQETCRTAALVVQFNLTGINSISISSINSNADLVVNKCASSSIDLLKNSCTSTGRVALKDLLSNNFNNVSVVPQPSSAASSPAPGKSFIELIPESGVWEDGTWYQVALKNSISRSNIYLAKDRPCNVANSAYCFLFKTGAKGNNECVLNGVYVSPSSFWVNKLMQPIAGLIYRAHGISNQKCIVVDISGYGKEWSSSEPSYAEIYKDINLKTAQVSSLKNTVGVLFNDLLNIVANFRTTTSQGVVKEYAGKSPLTIDLTNPDVESFWPSCSDACTNASVGAKFNTSMSNLNLQTAAQLVKCDDENCLNTMSAAVGNASIHAEFIGPNNDELKIQIIDLNLEPLPLDLNTIYQVILSSSSTDPFNPTKLWSGSGNDGVKPFNTEFKWRFSTKKKQCEVDRVSLEPLSFYANHIEDRNVYSASVFGVPDTCSTSGQRLNPYMMDWQWDSSDKDVAQIQQVSTVGANPLCTNKCVLKGSDISFGIETPICGNGIVEAGEDCDGPNKNQGCSLNCLRVGNLDKQTCGDGKVDPTNGEECDTNDNATKIGCDDKCLHAGSKKDTTFQAGGLSVCGNGIMGSGEDCEIGISATTSDPNSALYCSDKCLHTGTPLSKTWCDLNLPEANQINPFGGFVKSEFDLACKKSVSICGDGENTMDEDNGCDTLGKGQKSAWCDDYCLKNDINHPDSNCVGANNKPLEGCDSKGQHSGSSMLYTIPSFCGDGMIQTGEDNFCEDELMLFNHHAINPWALAMGKGLSKNTQGNPPYQLSVITATTTPFEMSAPKSGQAQFVIPCGFKTSVECQQTFGEDYGLGDNTCCYPKPNLIDVNPPSSSINVCPNTAIEATFDKVIDDASLSGNFIIARGIGKDYSSNAKVVGSMNNNVLTSISGLIFSNKYLFTAGSQGLSVVKADVPASLQLVSNSSANNIIGDLPAIDISNNRAYTTAGSNGLIVIDATDPTKPSAIGNHVPLQQIYNDLKVVGNFAYVTAGQDGLRVIDISSSTNPYEAGFVTSTGASQTLANFSNVDVVGNFAYVTAGQDGLRVIDISSSTNPYEVGFITSTSTGASQTIASFSNVDVAGNYAYVTAGQDGLRVIDISDKTAMKVVGILSTGQQNYYDLEVESNYAFVVDSSGSIQVVSVSDLSNISVAQIISITGAESINVSENFAYIGTALGISIVDVAKYTLSCQGNDDVTGLIAGIDKDKGQENKSWIVKIWSKFTEFVRSLLWQKAEAQSKPIKWCTGLDMGIATVLTQSNTTTSRASLALNKPLATDTDYTVILKSDLKDSDGVRLGTLPNGKSNSWAFKTGPQICKVKKVEVSPAQYYFSKYNATTSLEVKAFTDTDPLKSQQIQPIPGHYSWQYVWSPFVNDYVLLASQSSGQSTNVITSRKLNGTIAVKAEVEITEDKYSGSKGNIGISNKSDITIYLCENPWPPKDLIINNVEHIIFPYEDINDTVRNNDGYDFITKKFNNTAVPNAVIGGYFNFGTYYCADYGNTGINDDLPYLQPAVQVTGDAVQTGLDTLATSTFPLKRFLFTDTKTGDAIGIQIFANYYNLSVKDWFNKYRSFSYSANMGERKIHDYDAIGDSNNIYIDALNYTKDKFLYSNIYLVSVNSDAKPETRMVYNQMLKNLSFNINLTNYGYCGKDVNNIDYQTECVNDFDCAEGQICSAQIDKLKRNYKRLKDFRNIRNAISFAGSAPKLDEGSFIKGQSVSTWANSWSKLSGLLKIPMPVDPVNELGKGGTCKQNSNYFCVGDEMCLLNDACALHDPITGWSTEDARYSFACNKDSLAYRYIFDDKAGYYLRARMEDPFGNDPTSLSLNILNWKSDPINNIKGFTDNFISKNFIIDETSGICKLDQEVAVNVKGYCGDNKVGGLEECDGVAVKYDKSACTASGGNITISTCNTSTCNWIISTAPCSSLSVCGNSIKEIGEQCDAGSANNTYGVFCDENCKIKKQPYTVDANGKVLSYGYCGDGAITPFYEICDNHIWGGTTFVSGKPIYALDKFKSCSNDCQDYGPYCGDGAVQKNQFMFAGVIYNEECDVNNLTDSCNLTVSGQTLTGTKTCNTTTCKFLPCTTTQKIVSKPTPIGCNNGKIESGEDCDDGIDQTKTKYNGMDCTPTYSKGCEVCTTQCRILKKDRAGYCGDGIITSPYEICETVGTDIYVSATNTKHVGEVVSNVKDAKTNGYLVKKCSQETKPNLPYAPNYNLSFVKKGTKTCSQSCTAISYNCVLCGVKPDNKNGATVSGEIINVVDPTSSDPLLSGPAFPGYPGIVGLFINEGQTMAKSFGKLPQPLRKYKFMLPYGVAASTTVAVINDEPKCSFDTSYNYKVILNAGWLKPFNFPIISDSAAKLNPSYYDLVVSPLIYKSGTYARPNDIRVVLRWVNNTVDFIGGFMLPAPKITYRFGSPVTPPPSEYLGYDYWKDQNTMLTGVYSALLKYLSQQTGSINNELSDFQTALNNYLTNTAYTNREYFVDYVEYILNRFVSVKYAYSAVEGSDFTAITKGIDYYTKTSSQEYGLWYHGFGETKTGSGTRVESFTLDSSVLKTGSQYIFYVAVSDSSPIANHRNDSKLKVEVYLPDDYKYNDGTCPNSKDACTFPQRLFGPPDQSMVFEINKSDVSNTKTASYWQVFNLQASAREPNSVIKKLGNNNSGKIITDKKYFQFVK